VPNLRLSGTIPEALVLRSFVLGLSALMYSCQFTQVLVLTLPFSTQRPLVGGAQGRCCACTKLTAAGSALTKKCVSQHPLAVHFIQQIKFHTMWLFVFLCLTIISAYIRFDDASNGETKKNGTAMYHGSINFNGGNIYDLW
jgi:hypothetical protein